MSKPFGVAIGLDTAGRPTLSVTRPSRAADKIYDAVQEAISSGMSVRDFFREAESAWEAERRNELKAEMQEFRKRGF